ncbi:MAG TPA: hypothetical protein VGA44_03890, partial [Steroidobacteraceae bacterium]
WLCRSGTTLERFTAADITVPEFFRTDRGDDEGSEEWHEDRIDGCEDGRGDDDVDLLLRSNGTMEVAYRTAASECQ